MITANDHILQAFKLDGKGGGLFLKNDKLEDALRSPGLIWVHVEADHPNTRRWIEQLPDQPDETTLDALLADETRPRMIEYENTALIILRGVNLNEDAEPEDMVSLRIWVSENRIISARKRKLRAVLDLVANIENGTGPCNAGDFLEMICTRLFERMQPTFNEMEDKIDHIEDLVLDRPSEELRIDVVRSRRQATQFRRYMAPQKDVIGRIIALKYFWISEQNKHQLRENYDIITRYVENLDAIRDRSQIVQDELANALSEKLNKNIYVLSLIAGIFLPLSFLTGLLGINVAGIPGAQDPAAFWFFCILLTVIAALQLAIFKKLKWL